MSPLRVDIITIFPEYFSEAFDYGIVRRARAAGLVDIKAHDLRSWTVDKHHMVDDRPFGGGDGMVLKPEPIFAAIESLLGTSDKAKYPTGTRVVLLTPQGRPLKQVVAKEFADDTKHLVVICGRYEGVDERVNETLVTDEISIGDYVLTGGELPALVVLDAVVRLTPGVVGHQDSLVEDSFVRGLLDHPQYTRPAVFRDLAVPDVLVS